MKIRTFLAIIGLLGILGAIGAGVYFFGGYYSVETGLVEMLR